MEEAKQIQESLAPIFILADDDREATSRMVVKLPAEWFYVPVHAPNLAVPYAKRFATTAVLLADPIEYPKGGAERLLQELIDELGKPVIVLSEDWSEETQARWKLMGAFDCIPHPTRTGSRVEAVRARMQDCVLAALSGPLAQTPAASPTRGILP